MSIIDYGATGANRLKNWELMTKPALETLTYEDNENFWPFHETFHNHIENMGWKDIMNYTVDNIPKDLSTQFGEVPITVIENYRTNVAERPENAAAANVLRLKFKAMYTHLFNSIDKNFKRHLTLSVNTHHCMGPLAWKFITDHLVKNDNQTIRCALCSTHTISLSDFDYNVDKLITHIQQNLRVLKLKGFSINGISSGLQVLGYGTIHWVLHDDTNVPIDVEIDRALLIQNLPMRLLLPQQLARQTNGLRDGFFVRGDCINQILHIFLTSDFLSSLSVIRGN